MLHKFIQIIKKCHYEEPKGFGDEVIQHIISGLDKILHVIFYQYLSICWIATLELTFSLAMTETLYSEMTGVNYVS